MVFQRQILELKRGAFIQFKVAEITDTLTLANSNTSWQKDVHFL